MDNFILYDDICKTENSIIYKGRRKGSINFVAIHCIEKVLRPEITNLVRLTYEMSHRNAVKFFEWYETSNHLWLVVELCTAGTLDILLEQDGCLPETSIKMFGADICEGLFYIHSLGVLFCDLIPRKIMIDGSGTLKLSDFGLSKLEGEDLEQIFQETFDATSAQWSSSASSSKQPKVYKKPFGDLKYMAPEIVQGEDNTKESDIWNLGCILYQMYTGSVPFVSDDADQLRHMIINKELPNPKGNKLSTKPSPEFLSLLKGLLEKDPAKRLNWKQILHHPFWDNKLKHLLPTKSIIVDGKEQIVEDDDNEMNEHDDKVNTLNFSRISTDRPRTGAASSTVLDQMQPEMNASFSISSRVPISPQSTIHTRNALQYKESDVQSSTSTIVGSQQMNNENDADDVNDSPEKLINDDDLRRLFFLPSELNASQIVDNPKIQKTTSLKFEPKVLPFTNPKLLKAESFLKMPRDEFEKSLLQVKANTNVPSDKSAGAIKLKLHLMNYIGTICSESSRLADAFVQVELYKDLVLIIKNGHSLEMKMKAARILAILFNKAKKLDVSKELTEVLQSLLDIISANRKDVKFKQALLPALGEILYFISCQETIIGKTVEAWTIPSLAYVMMIRSIGEDLIVNHIICKIVENIACTSSQNVQKFLANQSEIVNALWSCFTHSGNNEQLRIDALNALCMLSYHSINIFITLIDKVGVDSVLDCLSHNNTHIQQIMLTMISILVNEASAKSFPEKKLIGKLIHIYESTNVVCRAKSYLLTYFLIKHQNELLLTFSQSKLINSLERDGRKNFVSKEENDYIHKTIENLTNLILNQSSTILDENVNALESVYGRKNPSTTQAKQLKKCIPNVSILKVLIISQSFRSKIFNQKFIENFSKLIKLSKPLNNGELNLDTICGPGVMGEYIDAVIGIMEILVQHKEMLKDFSTPIMKDILPSLIDNIDSNNSDLRVESLKVLSEICSLYFNKKSEIVGEDLRKELRAFIEEKFIDIVEKLFIQPEPLPFFSLTVLQSAINYDITLISTLKVRNILPSLFKLLQTYKSKIGSTFVIKLLNILNLWSSTIDPSDLYDNNIVDCLKPMLIDIARIKKFDDKTINETLIEILKIIDNLLKYVSEFVKKALQAKKSNTPNDSIAHHAEKLLHSNKPLVACCSFLISLLVNEDPDINDLSCKILWIIMQLFGTECKDLLSQESLNVFLVSVMNSNSKRQKILLRIIKRIITTDKQNMEIFKLYGHSFIENLKVLKNNANAEANVSLSSMIDEILKLA